MKVQLKLHDEEVKDFIKTDLKIKKFKLFLSFNPQILKVEVEKDKVVDVHNALNSKFGIYCFCVEVKAIGAKAPKNPFATKRGRKKKNANNDLFADNMEVFL